MNSCSLAVTEFLICLFFIIVDDNCRCTSVANFVVIVCVEITDTSSVIFYLVQISWPKFWICSLILYFYFNCIQVKRHYVVQLNQVFLRFSVQIYFCRNFSSSVMGCVPFFLLHICWTVGIILVRVRFLLHGLCLIGYVMSPNFSFIRTIWKQYQNYQFSLNLHFINFPRHLDKCQAIFACIIFFPVSSISP